MNPKQAHEILTQLIIQALGLGLFKDFNTAAVAQQALLALQPKPEEEKKA
jgi:hypothetical protein